MTTVLLVDDDPEVLDGLRRTLRREPYQLVSATSADEALRVIAREPIDVIVSDIDMPGTSGLELIAQIRREHPMIVRLLLTGDASLEAALHAINQGEVHRFLTKPWNKDELRETLRDAIDRLGELRRTAAAVTEVTARERLLAALEHDHPGITRVELVEDVYVVDPGIARRAFGEILSSRLREVFGLVDDSDRMDGTRRMRK